MSRQRAAVGSVELLGKRTVRLRVSCDYVKISVRICLDGIIERRVSGRSGGERSRGNGWNQVSEESQGRRRDSNGSLLVPNMKSIIKLLGCGESGEIPRVSIVVAVLWIPTDSYGLALSDAVVDRVNRAE